MRSLYYCGNVTALQNGDLHGQEVIDSACELLSSITKPTAIRAEYVPPKRRFWGTTKRAQFIQPVPVWPLGVLLLTAEGRLFAAGETTRAVPPGHPGHTSVERERRRHYTQAAVASGFPQGTVIYFHSPALPLREHEPQPEGSPLLWIHGQCRVRWNRAFPDSTVDFAGYITEHVQLLLETIARNEG